MTRKVCAALEAIPDALSKTGFVLEHRVAEEFRSAGWATIGGRYYADDVDGRARELDLIAYKTFKRRGVTVVYGVLVSCKKDAENTWVFLTREKPPSDPNFDWEPVHYWTDVNPLERYLQSEKWKGELLSRAGSAWDDLAATRDVFAFQQINSEKVVPKNDAAIFSSITTLMKGLDHELMALPQRQKGKKRIYFFSLLSVVEAPIAEVCYSSPEVKAKEVEAMTYFARYMVRKREIPALMRFVRSDTLPTEIQKIQKLAEAVSLCADSLVNDSFESIKFSHPVQEYFASKLQAMLGWRISGQLSKYRFENSGVQLTSVRFDSGKLMLGIEGTDADGVAFLNSDPELKETARSALKSVAKYEGDFEFEWDIPF